MFLLLLAYLGGILTILSPCILPVLPFVFARADQPFRKTGLPLLAGMAVMFVLVASLAAVGGGWAVHANQFGRISALILFGVFGLTLLSSSFAERLSRPLVRIGSNLSQHFNSSPGIASSFVLGIATGLLWAPCAGPILGLILTGAALRGPSVHTATLLLAYAAGAATSLRIALLAGGRVFAAIKRSLGAEEWIRRILGAAVLAGVAAVAFGLDRGVLTRISLANTSNLEQSLVDRFHPASQEKKIFLNQTINITDSNSGSEPSTLPDLSGATGWINSSPLTSASLRGKVVLVDFWTYSCINCLRTLPYIKAWYAKYKDSGLVIIGVHTPEFPFEKDEANVRKAVHELGLQYPVAMDNNYRIWSSFNSQAWPTDYFIDAAGRIRYRHVGEGQYDQSEAWIRNLLGEAHHRPLPKTPTRIAATGAEALADSGDIQSPETYIGYDLAQNFASPGGLNRDHPQIYRAPAQLESTNGRWPASGRTKAKLLHCSLRRAASSIAFMPVTFTSSWDLQGMGNQSTSASRSMENAPAQTTESTPTRMDTAP